MKKILFLLVAILSLVSSAQTGDETRNKIVLWPVFRYESGDETKLEILSSCVKWESRRESEPYRHLWMGTPAGLSLRWPLIMHEDGDEGTQWHLLRPIFKWEKDGDLPDPDHFRLWLATPLVFMYENLDEGRERNLAIATVFQDRRTSTSLGRWDRMQGLFPVYHWNFEGDGTRLVYLNPWLLFHERNRDGGSHYSLLDPFFLPGDVYGKERRVSVLSRAFDFRWHPDGDRQFSFLWRVFAYEDADDQRSLRILFSPRIPLGRK
jgi:hypothetical protein